MHGVGSTPDQPSQSQCLCTLVLEWKCGGMAGARQQRLVGSMQS